MDRCNLMCEAGSRTGRGDGAGRGGKLDEKVADGCVCATRAFLINTRMKVGCVEALGTSERLQVAAPVAPPPHYSIIQCLMFLGEPLSVG